MNVALSSNKEVDPKIVAKIDMNFKFISIINLTNQKTYEIVTEMLKDGEKIKLIADENFAKLTHGLGVYLNIFTIH